MKWEASEPYSPKGGNSCEISFATVLNTLCKTLPLFSVDMSLRKYLETQPRAILRVHHQDPNWLHMSAGWRQTYATSLDLCDELTEWLLVEFQDTSKMTH